MIMHVNKFLQEQIKIIFFFLSSCRTPVWKFPVNLTKKCELGIMNKEAAQASIKKLTSLPTISGELVDTYELSGHKTWFIFYRYANCPLCNLHFDELLSYADFFQKNNVRIVCFFESAKEKFPQRFLDFRWNKSLVMINFHLIAVLLTDIR